NTIQRIAVHVLCIDNRCFQRRSGNTPSKQSGRMVTPQKLVLMEPVCSNVYFYDMFLCNPSRRFEPQLPVNLIRHAFIIAFTKGFDQFLLRDIMRNFLLWEIFQVFFFLSFFLCAAHGFQFQTDCFLYCWFWRVFATVRFRLIKKGELSCNLAQFFCMPSKTLLVC